MVTSVSIVAPRVIRRDPGRLGCKHLQHLSLNVSLQKSYDPFMVEMHEAQTQKIFIT